ncbi:MAG: carbon starvation protein A [Firmicutes bacterium]|nr:carbon starvation protein A [Bacillota bacterium]
MGSILIALGTFVGFIIAYNFYGKYISTRIFEVNPANETPSHQYKDGVDYVPTDSPILFGHHFTSIAGAAPIVGPAIAVIWGWVPAVLWVVFGSIFLGAVHDFSSLMISARNEGKSIGEISDNIVNNRVRTLFLLFIFFTLLILIAVFALIIAILFETYPHSVFPVWMEIPIAITLGFLVYRKGKNVLIPSLIALALMYITIWIGIYLPFEMPAILGLSPRMVWVIILMIYAYIASVLPVWTLLQARDFINSHELMVGLVLIIAGLFIARPEIVAPAFNPGAAGAPPIIPFLFITIACGAISGFHSTVSSGTTVKQLESEKDARFIGYGGMLAEGILATMVIIACIAGFSSLEAWTSHYASWSAANGLAAKVSAFVEGGSSFLTSLGLTHTMGTAILSVLVVSFAATTLDSATRIQRYVISELASDFKIKPLASKHGATLVAVIAAFLLASINGGAGGMILWPLFGAANQMLAALALLVATVYLLKKQKPIYVTMLPFIFMVIIETWALLYNINQFYGQGNALLTTIGTILFVLEVWMVVESCNVFNKARKGELSSSISA